MYTVSIKSPFILIFFIGTILTFLVNHLLEYIDFKARIKNSGKLPETLENIPEAKALFDNEKLQKISTYENSKYFIWIPNALFSLALTLDLVLFGFYPWIFDITCRITSVPHSFWTVFANYIVFSILVSIPETILDIPFSLYREFVIEKKFGFSNMTFKLWISDQIKSLLVGLIPAVLLGLAMSFAFTFFENSWWLIVSVVLIVFILLVQIIYPKFIAPLFNKFEPLPDGELKDKITEILQKTGFKNGGLFVMDASKRSGHSNAYFSGFGKNKRIVLYDTLIKELSTDELAAVLCHELGHFKLKHITKRLVLSLPLVFVTTYIVFRFVNMESLYRAFGFVLSENVEVKWIQYIGITLISMVWASVSEILTPFGNIFSRKHEYEADRFAAKIMGNSKALETALIKLNSQNLSELFPPPVYVWWNYSHPTLVQRINALEKIEKSWTSETEEKK